MTTLEIVDFDPDAQRRRPSRPLGDARFPITDAGARAVFGLLLVLFVIPLILVGRSAHAEALAGTGVEFSAALWMALLAVLLPLIQIFMHIRRFGGPAIRGNRDAYPVARGAAGRIARAHANLIESLVPFAVAVGATQLLHISTGWTVAAAQVYLAARCIHTLTYGLGITVIRSAAFYAGVVATAVIVCHALLAL